MTTPYSHLYFYKGRAYKSILISRDFAIFVRVHNSHGKRKIQGKVANSVFYNPKGIGFGEKK